MGCIAGKQSKAKQCRAGQGRAGQGRAGQANSPHASFLIILISLCSAHCAFNNAHVLR